MDTFFGIPLRKRKQSDDEFVEGIHRSVQNRKRIRIIWPLMAITFILFIIMYIILFQSSPIEELSDVSKYKWAGFFSGFMFGGICFVVIVYSIIAIINWFDGLAIHRTEELLLKYYKEGRG
jgi:NADH:ubiquinone oxidoreductase subunit 3 (subunit A)